MANVENSRSSIIDSGAERLEMVVGLVLGNTVLVQINDTTLELSAEEAARLSSTFAIYAEIASKSAPLPRGSSQA